MTDDFERARENLRIQRKHDIINERQFAQRMRAVDTAEGRKLVRDAHAAMDRLSAFQDRIDRAKVRKDLLRKLSQSLKRYQDLPA